MFDDNNKNEERLWFRQSGFGRPFGKWFGPHFSGFGRARFERGDLKLVILDLLKNKTRHGYDIIQELERQFHGFYSPSPGSVYPILQLLEDQEFVISDQKGGKKVYTITEVGEKFLAENAKEIEILYARVKPHWGEQGAFHMYELREEIGKTAQLIFCNAAQGALNNPHARKRIHEAFESFRKDIEAIFAELDKSAKK